MFKSGFLVRANLPDFEGNSYEDDDIRITYIDVLGDAYHYFDYSDPAGGVLLRYDGKENAYLEIMNRDIDYVAHDNVIEFVLYNGLQYLKIAELEHKNYSITDISGGNSLELLFGDISTDSYDLCKVSFNGLTLEADFSSSEIEVKNYDIYARIDVPILNKRKKPSTESEIVGKLKQGEVLKVINYSSNDNIWVQLEDGSWIASWFTTLRKEGF